MSDFQKELDAAEDIVVLMRKWAEVLDIPSGSFVNDDCRKAADEINSLRVENDALAKSCAAAAENYARLRAEVERLEEDKQAIRYCNDTQAGVIDALRARVEKLEGALKRIANEPRDIDKSDWELFAEVCNEARAALGDTHE